jgi:hypothetical protein
VDAMSPYLRLRWLAFRHVEAISSTPQACGVGV